MATRIPGGAETLAREWATHLPRPEFEVDVLTINSIDLETWRNELPPGLSTIDGIRVQRFPIDHHFRDAARFRQSALSIWHASAGCAGRRVCVCLLQRAQPRALCLPRTAWPGIRLFDLRAVSVWPNLVWHAAVAGAQYHLAVLARRTLRSFLARAVNAGSVQRFVVHYRAGTAVGTGQLGIRQPHAEVIGSGVDEYDAQADRFRRKYGVHEPFMLYAGRFDSTKNLLELFNFFIEYQQLRPEALKLVLLGSGPLSPPRQPDIISLGFVDEVDKRDAFAAATVVCQPSLWESFSIVLMEAWLAGKPVLVHGDCEVTRDHVQRSNGGLYYTTFDEFAGALDWLVSHPTERAQ